MTRVFPPAGLVLLLAIQAVVVTSLWIPPRTALGENNLTIVNSVVAKIHSDYDDRKGNIVYMLKGKGANEYPMNRFVINSVTGEITLTQVLDREEYSSYNLSGVAIYKATNKRAEEDVAITFKVKDENDNPPIFDPIKPGEVYELSAKGTSVMKITATDADEPGNVNSKISYSIVKQQPNNMFYITSDGIICVNDGVLDRETADKYTLTVKAQDLDGNPRGNYELTTVDIKIKDVNDNLPTLEQEQYEGSINENTKGVEVMRLKANDLDLENTESWEAVYEIAQGNEAGYFSIKTDPETNEGILMLNKEVDYETMKNLDLGIIVKNKAPPFDGTGSSGGGISFGGGGSGSGSGGGSGSGSGGGGSGSGSGGGGSGSGSGGWIPGSSYESGIKYKTYPVKINVNNMPELPAFDPKVKSIPVSEGDKININEVISFYPAIDGDTGKPAEGVRYAKGSDPDNWFTIDPTTAEIKLNKIPDRESPFLVNGTYIGKVLCISEDMPDTTATGTIAIQVEDSNDHCPKITTDHVAMCTSANHIIVVAKDEDTFPNGPPFDFKIVPEGTEGKWQVEYKNETAAILRAQEKMWPGFYKIALQVKDYQGYACPEPQEVEIPVCTCKDGVGCGSRLAGGLDKSSVFGPAGIGLLFLGLLMLLLIPLLLLFCHCGSPAGMPGAFAEMPFDTKSNLINYHTEGQGENTAVPLLNMPTVDGDMIKMDMGTKSAMPPMGSMGFQQSVVSMDGMNGGLYEDGYGRENMWGMTNGSHASGLYSDFQGRSSSAAGGLFNGMALPDHILGDYYDQKLASTVAAVDDTPLVHEFEGRGSPAGSVGCCSEIESDNDLHFLDDLGPKFKTLAEICVGKRIQTEVQPVVSPPTSLVSSYMNTQTLPPPPQPLPTIPTVERTVVRETVRDGAVREGVTTVRDGAVREGVTTVRETKVRDGVTNKGQVLLLQQQQPVYYTTTPVVQPMHYVVQPQVQNTVLLAEAPPTNLQGMVLVNGTQAVPAQSMVVQGQPMMSTAPVQGPGMVLVGGGGVQTGPQTMMVVEGKVPAGSVKVLKGGQTSFVQGGTLKTGPAYGSQQLLEGQVKVLKGSQSNLVQGGNLSGSQVFLDGAAPTGSIQVIRGSQSNLLQGGGLQSGLSGSQRVLVVGGAPNTGGQLIQGAGSNTISSTTTTVKATPVYSKTVVTEKLTEL